MYMRLWWKEARQFWPIWAFLAAVAWGTPGVVGLFGGIKERELAMLPVPLAMGLTCLYAFAVSAAAFAGEREAGTLALLDTMPARRRDVWGGKVSFAVVSTIGLAGVLLLLAAGLAPPYPEWPWGRTDGNVMLRMSGLIGHALAWGLLCSSVSSNALMAAVSAIVLTTIFGSAPTVVNPSAAPDGLLAAGLIPALTAVAASWAAFTRGQRDRGPAPALRFPLTMRLRSPIEVSWAGRPLGGAGRRRAAVVAKPAGFEPPIAAHRPPIVGAAGEVDRPRPRSRLAEFRSLVGQTMREGRPTWLFLAAIGMVGPGLLLMLDPPGSSFDPSVFALTNAMTALVGGVSVFGLENRRRTQRFLVHHGASPGLVWLAKLSAWCLGLATIWGPSVYLLYQQVQRVGNRPPINLDVFGPSFLVLPLGFAVAVLCGMAIPRGITAGVVALVVSLLLGAGEMGLLMTGMLPAWGLLALPAALLAVSRAWSGDWLLDRPAPGRWIRLGALTTGVLTAVLGGYAGWRAYSVEDIGPIPMPSDWVAATAPLPDDLNAAGLYREAARRLNLNASGSLPTPRVAPNLGENLEAFDLIRRAAARPECQFFNPGRMTLATRPDLPPMRELGEAILAQARVRLHAGDLAAAWDDLMIAFRMARHVGQGATMIQALAALAIERSALDLARDWANAPGQSPDRLREAREAYRGLPTRTPPPDVVRAEGLLVERSIDLPIDDLRDLMAKTIGAGHTPQVTELLKLDLIATPWERARSRRVNRLLIDTAARFAALEPRQRPMGAHRPGLDVVSVPEALYSLVGMLQPNIWSYMGTEDHAEVDRRALVYVLAVREWQLRHDGRFPEKLEELVPDVLPTLPTDPFFGRPFGYTTLDQAKGINPEVSWPTSWPGESRLIHSVGDDFSDRRDMYTSHAVVFPIFPAAPKEEAR